MVAQLVCGVDVRLRSGVVTCRRRGRCERQKHKSSDLVAHELGLVMHSMLKNSENFGHMTVPVPYLKNTQFNQYFASETSSQAMSDFYPMSTMLTNYDKPVGQPYAARAPRRAGVHAEPRGPRGPNTRATAAARPVAVPPARAPAGRRGGAAAAPVAAPTPVDMASGPG